MQCGDNDAPDFGKNSVTLFVGAGAVSEISADKYGRLVLGPENCDVVGGGFAVGAGLVCSAPVGGQ